MNNLILPSDRDGVRKQSNAFNEASFTNIATISRLDLLEYSSPITIISSQIRQQIENDILKVAQDVKIDVDKDELLKALKYDREQYDKGYECAKREFGKYAHWNKCEDKLPDILQQVLVQTTDDVVYLVYFYGKPKIWGGDGKYFKISKEKVKYWAEILPLYTED